MKLDPTPARRSFLATGLLGAAATLLTPSRATALIADTHTEDSPSNGPRPEAGTHPPVPSDALARLREGNKRVVAGRPTGPNRGLDRITAVAPSQAPFAAILGCADSRVLVGTHWTHVFAAF